MEKRNRIDYIMNEIFSELTYDNKVRANSICLSCMSPTKKAEDIKKGEVKEVIALFTKDMSSLDSPEEFILVRLRNDEYAVIRKEFDESFNPYSFAIRAEKIETLLDICLSEEEREKIQEQLPRLENNQSKTKLDEIIEVCQSFFEGNQDLDESMIREIHELALEAKSE